MFFSVIFGFLCVPAFRLSQVRIMEWTSYKGDRVNCSSEKDNNLSSIFVLLRKVCLNVTFLRLNRSSASTSPFWSFNFFFGFLGIVVVENHSFSIRTWIGSASGISANASRTTWTVISFDSWHPGWFLYMEFLWMGPLLNGPFLNR